MESNDSKGIKKKNKPAHPPTDGEGAKPTHPPTDGEGAKAKPAHPPTDGEGVHRSQSYPPMDGGGKKTTKKLIYPPSDGEGDNVKKPLERGGNSGSETAAYGRSDSEDEEVEYDDFHASERELDESFPAESKQPYLPRKERPKKHTRAPSKKRRRRNSKSSSDSDSDSVKSSLESSSSSNDSAQSESASASSSDSDGRRTKKTKKRKAKKSKKSKKLRKPGMRIVPDAERNKWRTSEKSALHVNYHARNYIDSNALKSTILDEIPVPSNVDPVASVDKKIQLSIKSRSNMDLCEHRNRNMEYLETRVRDALGPLLKARSASKSKRVKTYLDQATVVLGQAHVIVKHHRRMNVLSGLLGFKRAKTLINTNQNAFTDEENDLFGEKFRSVLSKKDKEDLFEPAQPRSRAPTESPRRRPFRGGPSHGRGAQARPQYNGGGSGADGNGSGRGQANRGGRGASTRGRGECSNVTPCSPHYPFPISHTNRNLVKSPSGRQNKIVPKELGKIDKRPNNFANGRGGRYSTSQKPGIQFQFSIYIFISGTCTHLHNISIIPETSHKQQLQ